MAKHHYLLFHKESYTVCNAGITTDRTGFYFVFLSPSHMHMKLCFYFCPQMEPRALDYQTDLTLFASER